jgi:MFS family permease
MPCLTNTFNVSAEGYVTFASAAIVLLADSSNRMDPGPVLLGALALFGIGLGFYIAPNNAATMEAAPEGRSPAAGGLLNLMRVLGCMGGIVIASSALSWRLHVDTGFTQRTMEASTSQIMSAIH